MLVPLALAADGIEIVTPHENEKQITIRIPAGDSNVIVDVLDADTARVSPSIQLIQVGTCPSPIPTGQTCALSGGVQTVGFNNGLAAGQIVRVQATKSNNTLDGPVEVEVESSVFNWGRARAYFSLGTVLAKSQSEFSSPSLYLGLNVDYSWRQSDWKQTHGGWAFNTFFDARLTQVPVATAAGVPDLSITANTLLQSKHSGFVEAGAYLPKFWGSTRWRYHRTDYALFLAPLLKGGFQTVREGTIDGLTADQAQAAQIDGKDVYRFLAGGTRIGLVNLPGNSKNASPQLLNYIDVTVGRWDNLRVTRPGIQPVGGAGFQYPLRFDAEGVLSIPHSGLFVGFGLNAGAGADDLRFIFGTRFDVSQLLSRVVPTH
jgi:hypothetical protein